MPEEVLVESAPAEEAMAETITAEEAGGQAAEDGACAENVSTSTSPTETLKAAGVQEAVTAREADTEVDVSAEAVGEKLQEEEVNAPCDGPAAPASVGATSTKSRSSTNYEELLDLPITALLPDFSSSEGSDDEKKLRKRGKKRKHKKEKKEKKEKRSLGITSSTPTPSRAGAAALESRSKKAKKDNAGPLRGEKKERFLEKVLLAVDEYVAKHKDSWTTSVMRSEVAEDNGWENDNEFGGAVKSALQSLGFAKGGANVIFGER